MSAERNAPRLYLDEFLPDAELVTRTTMVEQPRYPVVDFHNHAEGPFGAWLHRPVNQLVRILDESGVKVFVDLDGGWGEAYLDAHLRDYKEVYPDRFAIFGGVDWTRWPEDADRFGEKAADRLIAQVGRGAQGLKVWKPLGLSVRDQHGSLVAVDDTRLDALWAAAGQLGVPVLMHVGDPVAFFRPLDHRNERYEELASHPDWHFHGSDVPSFETIIEAFARVVLRHTETTFVGAHVGCYAENLGWVAQLLDAAPNLAIDISERISELGRQPYTARRFFIDHADRILFGLDLPARVEAYRLSYRFLETDDEYFSASATEPPAQGRWNVYGLALPDDVLRKVYLTNAYRILRLPTPQDQVEGAHTPIRTDQ